MKITFRGLPWHKTRNHLAHIIDGTHNKTYGWNPFTVKGMGRFGGGWAFKLGITASSTFKEIIIEFVFGSVRINFNKTPREAIDAAMKDSK